MRKKSRERRKDGDGREEQREIQERIHKKKEEEGDENWRNEKGKEKKNSEWRQQGGDREREKTVGNEKTRTAGIHINKQPHNISLITTHGSTQQNIISPVETSNP